MQLDTLLLVEDDEGLLNSCVRYFQAFLPINITVRTAMTKVDALAIIASTDHAQRSCVITDLRVPKKGDGECIILAAHAKGISVIVFSGSLDDLSETVRIKCMAVFDKSVGLEPVIETLKQ